MTNDIVEATRQTCKLLGIDRARRGLRAFTARREGLQGITCFIGEACGGTFAGVDEFLEFSHANVDMVYGGFEYPEARSIIYQAVLGWLAEQEAIEAVTQTEPGSGMSTPSLTLSEEE